MKTWKTQLAGAVLIVVMAVSLGIEASHLPRKGTASNLPSPVPIAHRTCAQAEAISDNLGTTQANDGAFSACLRVGPVAAGSYQITARSFSKTAIVGTIAVGVAVVATVRSFVARDPRVRRIILEMTATILLTPILDVLAGGLEQARLAELAAVPV